MSNAKSKAIVKRGIEYFWGLTPPKKCWEIVLESGDHFSFANTRKAAEDHAREFGLMVVKEF